ncbi:heterokaryon incompatibility protein-domain-containing protein [Achaetomium macrosporum]|uniref:Heterokaryon incompatibility protein-domain-containing protein n=1 Tax=Achaetomium macrosporum TaxID=79813 RepID=A0AAN7HFJ0_9PEZI|nr:heterokaryon incompatibility protein-domain-containing protein [Achaetomium macrosporum]
MRLNTETFQLETFVSHETASYAILSHTWGKDETLFEDIRSKPPGPLNNRPARLATPSEGYRYIWNDTCCIDKSSSAELSEAINSMFEWYRTSQVCYAYLSDITRGHAAKLDSSRWFTRGWTLQELIVPSEVLTLAAHLSDITGIDEAILLWDPGVNVNRLLAKTSVAARMSLIRHRQTTRKEDIAYCLIGLFDVNMPLLYGEGTKAYARLQQEIIRNLDDQSILAHWTPGLEHGADRILAGDPHSSRFTSHLPGTSRRVYGIGISIISKNRQNIDAQRGPPTYCTHNWAPPRFLPPSRIPANCAE